jgi:DNA topoisomerase-6 subunit A
MIIVDRQREFDRLVRCSDLAQLRVVLMTGCGIPRAQARRFAHRLQAETHIPIYVLGDNDTWNYFAFSVLKTGSVVPGRTIPFLAIKDVRYLGLTTVDVRQHFSAQCFRRRWKRAWRERVACLSAYDCFQTPQWQSEFKRFTEQGFAVDLSLALSQFEGKEVWEQLLLPKLAAGQWLP